MPTMSETSLQLLKAGVLQTRIEVFLTEHKHQSLFSSTEVRDFLIDLWTEIGEAN